MYKDLSIRVKRLLLYLKSAKASSSSDKTDVMRQSLLDIAVEEYRMREILFNIKEKLNISDVSRFESKCRYFSKEVEKALNNSGFHIIGADEFIGEPFDIGMAVKPINIDNFNQDDKLIIEQMIEPVIMEGEKIARAGAVKLRRR